MLNTSVISFPFIAEAFDQFKVCQFLKSPGDYVEEGDPFIEVETENALFEIPADFNGIVIEYFVGVESIIKPDDKLCIVYPQSIPDIKPLKNSLATIDKEQTVAREIISFYVKLTKMMGLPSNTGPQKVLQEVKNLITSS